MEASKRPPSSTSATETPPAKRTTSAAATKPSPSATPPPPPDSSTAGAAASAGGVDEEAPGYNVVVLQPGAQWLCLGRAADALPRRVPHVLARRRPPPAAVTTSHTSTSTMSTTTTTTSRPKRRTATTAAAASQGEARSVRHAAAEETRDMAAAVAMSEVATLRGVRGQVLPGTRGVTPVGALTKANASARPRAVPAHQDPEAEDVSELADDETILYGHAALTLSRTTDMSATGSTTGSSANGSAAGGGGGRGWEVLWPLAGGVLPEARGWPAALADLSAHWAWALESQLGLTRARLRRCRAVLLLPDTARRRLRKDLLALLLQDLGFGAAMVHYESVAASFAAGLSHACVVNVGHATTDVSCVVEGVSVPGTRLRLPYGFGNVAATLHWLMRRAGCFAHDAAMAQGFHDVAAPLAVSGGEGSRVRNEETETEKEDKGKDAASEQEQGKTAAAAACRAMLVFAEQHCTLTLDGLKPTDYVFHFRRPGEGSQRTSYRLDKELALAPLGYFYPDLLALPPGARKLVEQGRDRRLDAEDMVIADNRGADISSLALNTKARPTQLIISGTASGPPVLSAEKIAQLGLGGSATATTPSPAPGVPASPQAAPADDVSNVPASPEPPASPDSGPSTPVPEDQAGELTKPAPPQESETELPKTIMVPLLTPRRIMPLDEAILASIFAAPLDARKNLFSSIIIAGGGTMPHTFGDFLQQRLYVTTPVGAVDEIVVLERAREMDPRYLVWRGGAIMALLGNAADCFITQDEWARKGVRAARERLPFAW